MSHLKDEPLEKVMSDEKDMVEALLKTEAVYGTVQCDHCGYWGRMDGYIEPQDKKRIKFVCPDCNTVEFVSNPEHL